DKLVLESLQRLVRRSPVLAFTSVRQLLRAIEEIQPDLVFNLTQHAHEDRSKDVHICAVLELEGIPYTGSGIRGLVLGRDKAISKQLAAESGFDIPQFFVVDRGPVVVPKETIFPAIVKPRYGDSSEGISQASVVRTPRALIERVRLLRRMSCQAVICEEFIE